MGKNKEQVPALNHSIAWEQCMVNRFYIMQPQQAGGDTSRLNMQLDLP